MRFTGKRMSVPATGSEGSGPMSMTYLALRRSSFIGLSSSGLSGDRGGLRGGDELAQHEGQDAAVQVVVDLDRRVDAHQHVDFLRRAVGAMDHELRVHLRLDAFLDA